MVIMHDGSMFKSLRRIYEETDYYKDHKTFELITDKSITSNNLGIYYTPATSRDILTFVGADKQAFLPDFAAKSSKVSTRCYSDDQMTRLSHSAHVLMT